MGIKEKISESSFSFVEYNHVQSYRYGVIYKIHKH